MKKFVVSWEDIKEARVTDVYFLWAREILKKEKKDKRVVAEVKAMSLPSGYKFGILCGVEELGYLLRELNVKSWVMPEGSLFFPQEPVLTIEGMWCDFGIYETVILGYLCQASGVATKAAHLRIKAGEGKLLLSFGARRMHPAICAVIERAAYIGGMDGTSVKLVAELLGLKPKGTMPHAFVIICGNVKEAGILFDKVIEEGIPRAVIVDTFWDEKTEAISIAEQLKDRLFAVRLDTPSSRRGNFKEIIEEVRWELDIRGYKDVKIFVSGGIDEKDIEELRDIVDGFGVGTTLSNAPVINFAMDVVEVEGVALAKRGKKSGKKQVFLCKECKERSIELFNQKEECKRCEKQRQKLLVPFTEEKKVILEFPSEGDIRNYVLSQLRGY